MAASAWLLRRAASRPSLRVSWAQVSGYALGRSWSEFKCQPYIPDAAVQLLAGWCPPPSGVVSLFGSLASPLHVQVAGHCIQSSISTNTNSSSCC